MPDDADIDDQVRQCVAHCLEDIDPPSCVKNYAAGLVPRHGWAQPDADLVAERSLNHIVQITGDESILRR